MGKSPSRELGAEMTDVGMGDLSHAMALFGITFPTLRDYDGKPLRFNLKKNEHLWNYYRGKSGALYAYTPHADTNGHYWVFTYRPVGKNARTPKADRHTYKLVDPIRCARRKTALSKCFRRWQDDKGAPHGS